MTYFFIAIMLISTLAVNAQQNVEFQKENFLDNPDLYKKISKALRQGDIHFSNKDYGLAKKNFLIADSANSENAALNYKLGICSFILNTGDAGLRNFTKAQQLFGLKDKELQFYIARAALLSGEFSLAETVFEELQKNFTQEETGFTAADIQKYIAETKTAKELILDKDTTFLCENLGDSINSEFNDYGIFFEPDGEIVYFTSARNNFSNSRRGDDIFFSQRKDSLWTTAKSIGKPVNSLANDAVIGISSSGSTMYVFADMNNGDIFTSEKDSLGWGEPLRFASEITSEKRETSPCFSADGRTMYFISDRTGSLGGNDIFKSNLQTDGIWTTPENLGGTINTSHDEISLFLSGDTLFFSSGGHKTMGGFDIFRTVKKDSGTWSVPENMGIPTNSPADDFFYIRSNGTQYLSSSRLGGMGGSDIFVLNPVKVQKVFVASMPDSVLRTAPQIIFSENISFEVNKYQNSEANSILDIIANFLKINQEAKVTIIGYTDSQGNDKYNQQLSEKRAKFAADYLISKGAKKEALTVKGRGEANQISRNKTPKGKYLWKSLKYNRRVEFVVTKQGKKSQLSVKQIEIPEEYKLNPQNGNREVYSIWLNSYAGQVDLSKFSAEAVFEIKNSDENFDYCSGKFTSIKDAEAALAKLIKKYPNAFIFLN